MGEIRQTLVHGEGNRVSRSIHAEPKRERSGVTYRSVIGIVRFCGRNISSDHPGKVRDLHCEGGVDQDGPGRQLPVHVPKTRWAVRYQVLHSLRDFATGLEKREILERLAARVLVENTLERSKLHPREHSDSWVGRLRVFDQPDETEDVRVSESMRQAGFFRKRLLDDFILFVRPLFDFLTRSQVHQVRLNAAPKGEASGGC
jgi:hypothetical protein